MVEWRIPNPSELRHKSKEPRLFCVIAQETSYLVVKILFPHSIK